MTHKDISPRDFKDLGSFEDAFVAHRLSQFEPILKIDDYITAQRKAKLNSQAADCAKEDAWEIWSSYVERMEDLYERGIGPAWDYC